MLTFVIMKVLWTSKSRPSTTEHNEKKQNAIPAAEFSMSFAASAVWPPATGTEVWNKADFLVLSFRFGSFPFVKRFQKKKTLDIENLQPAISLSGNPFPFHHCFFEATLTCRTLWARAHQTPLFVSRDGNYISEFTLVWPEMEIRLKDSLQHFRDTCCNTRNEVQVQCAPEFSSWLLVYWVLTKSQTFENSQRLLLHVLALHGVVMNFLQAILYTKCHGKFMEILLETPLNINMEHNHGGLEDHFPFQMGDL